MAAPTQSSSTALGGNLDAGTAHKPYIPDDAKMPEFTFSALIVGACLGIIFAASSLYLVLKIGMTVSASIPVSVLAITLFRAFSRLTGLRQATILENNIVQTTGSAGESIAFGVGVTMPALLILGFEMDIQRVMVVSILGGLLGILAMIPLRRAFIVKMHGTPGQPGTLLYPEGTACAQVLISGEKGGTSGTTVFAGFGIAFVHKFITEGMNILVGTVKLPITVVNRAATFAGEMASELLGVGYIIGLRTSAVMMAGAVLGYLIIIPLLSFVGDAITDQPVPPGNKLIRDMNVNELRNNYLLFIGAGCVATAGIISMFHTLPMILRSIRAGLKTVRQGAGNNDTNGNGLVVRRTEDDMSMRIVLLGSLGLLILLALFLLTEVGLVASIAGATLVLVFGFLFVTVSTRLTGEIGSSSNPISGMTVATLTLTCLIFLALGWTSSPERVLALSIAAVVCVAASNGGTTAQSLKTGFLVGGTPRYMQYAILIGALTSALVIGFTLVKGFNDAGTVYSQRPENLPNITLSKDQLAQIRERTTYEGKQYIVWDTRRNYEFTTPITTTVKEGRYLIDPETGKPAWLKDDTIMGKLTETDDGRKVKREFDAPKTQVMGIIINGVLSRKLNWGLVLIGALIAVMLELSGVSALAFAVGLYVPIQYSTPIFLGGVIRWAVDRYTASQNAGQIEAAGDDPAARARAEIEAIRKSETSPGVLLAAGYIAGGSLAGMLIAFTNFSDTLPETLSTWQYTKVHLSAPEPFAKWADETARANFGYGTGSLTPEQTKQVDRYVDTLTDLNSRTLESLAPLPRGTRVKLPRVKEPFVVEKDTTAAELAREKLGSEDKIKALFEANKSALVPWIRVPQGVTVRLPNTYAAYIPTREMTLGEIALNALKDPDKAESIYQVNSDLLRVGSGANEPWVRVARGTKLTLPDGKDFTPDSDTTVGEVARTVVMDPAQAWEVYRLNQKALPKPEPLVTPDGIGKIALAETLPAGTTLKLPQKDGPALICFALLILILTAVGTGKLMKTQQEQ